MPFVLPELPFDRAALEPHISAETFDYHHGKHHQAYVDKTNELAAAAGVDEVDLVALIRAAAREKKALFNQSGQLWNHSFFWQCLTPGGQRPAGNLAERIERDLGGYDAFAEAFAKEAVGHFASGWAWLVEQDGQLRITSLHDGDTPVAHEGMNPLLTVDLWEHAYYIDYRNARPKFVEAVLANCINWQFVGSNLGGNGVEAANQRGRVDA